MTTSTAVRTCRKCGSEITRKFVTDRMASWCQECQKLRQRCRRVGITLEQYWEVMDRQQGICACCSINPATELDHDHKTGQFRGILCQRCNLLIGWLERLPEGGIDRVEEYLK